MAQRVQPPCALDIEVITSSTLKLDGFCRGGKSRNVMQPCRRAVQPGAPFSRAAARPTHRALFWMALISVSPPRLLQYLLTAVLLFAYLWKSKTGCVIEARK